MSDFDEYFPWILGIIAVILIILIVIAGIEDQKQWSTFKEQHKCKVVAHIRGDKFNTFGVGANGQMVVGVGSTPNKTGYLCDDGQTYYR